VKDFSTAELAELVRATGWDPAESMVLASWRDADRLWGELMDRPGFQERFDDTRLWPIDDEEDIDVALITVDVGGLRVASLCQDSGWMVAMVDAPAVDVLRELTVRVDQIRTGLLTALTASQA
jgi:hypothetical protein